MNDFEISDVEATRSQLEINRHISHIREECGNLDDMEQSLRCFSKASDMDKDFNEIFRE